MVLCCRVLIAVSLAATAASALAAFPHQLAYFNELAGGPANGHNHLLGSNLDWGQDLIYLKEWVDSHPEARPFHLAYHGYFDPAQLGLRFPQPPRWWDSPARPEASPELPPGWYAVSVNYIRGYLWSAPHGTWTRFQELPPVARAGYSVYIYHVPFPDRLGFTRQ